MQVLKNGDTEGLLGYGQLVNQLASGMEAGRDIARRSGLDLDDINIEPSLTILSKLDGKTYKLTLSVVDAEGEDDDE